MSWRWLTRFYRGEQGSLRQDIAGIRDRLNFDTIRTQFESDTRKRRTHWAQCPRELLRAPLPGLLQLKTHLSKGRFSDMPAEAAHEEVFIGTIVWVRLQ